MKEIIERVFLGNSWDASSFISVDPDGKGWINPRGIVAVVNCTRFDEGKGMQVENCFDEAHRKDSGFPFEVRYLFLDIVETSKITSEMARGVIDFIDENVKRGGVLVHCAAGLSRSPSIILVYLLSKGIPFIEGLHLIELMKEANIYPKPQMLRSIAKLKIDGKTVHDIDMSRFTNKYRY